MADPREHLLASIEAIGRVRRALEKGKWEKGKEQHPYLEYPLLEKPRIEPARGTEVPYDVSEPHPTA